MDNQIVFEMENSFYQMKKYNNFQIQSLILNILINPTKQQKSHVHKKICQPHHAILTTKTRPQVPSFSQKSEKSKKSSGLPGERREKNTPCIRFGPS